jgi:hypothetical protein
VELGKTPVTHRERNRGKIDAGDVIEHEVSAAEMAVGEVSLNRPLAL